MPPPNTHRLTLSTEKSVLSENLNRDLTLETGVGFAQAFNIRQNKNPSGPPTTRAIKPLAERAMTPWIDVRTNEFMKQQSEISDGERDFLDKLKVDEIEVEGLTCYICRPSYAPNVPLENTWIYVEGNGFGACPFDINFRKSAWVALADQTNARVIVICTPTRSRNLVIDEQARELSKTLVSLSEQHWVPSARKILTAGYSSGATLLLLALNKLCESNQINHTLSFEPHFIGMIPFVQPMSDYDERSRLYPKSDKRKPEEKTVQIPRTATPSSLEDLSDLTSYDFYYYLMCSLTPSSLGYRDGQSFTLTSNHFDELIKHGITPVIHNLTEDPLSQTISKAIKATNKTDKIILNNHRKSHYAPWCDSDLIKAITRYISKSLCHPISPALIYTSPSKIKPRSSSLGDSPTPSLEIKKRPRSTSLGAEPTNEPGSGSSFPKKGTLSLFSPISNASAFCVVDQPLDKKNTGFDND